MSQWRKRSKHGLFAAKENSYMEMSLFDWPIVLQYDVKAKYRLICRKFSGMKFFHPKRSLTNQPRAFVSVVVQFFPWFKFSFLLFWGIVMYDNKF